MKLNNEFLTGIAVGVGVALLLNSNKTAMPPMGPVKQLPGKTSPGTSTTSMMGYSRKYPRMGYPVQLGF